MPSGVKPVPQTPESRGNSGSSAPNGISLIRARSPFSPSVPPKSWRVVHTKLAPQNEALSHFFHSPSPLTDMSMTLNLPGGVMSMKDLSSPACFDDDHLTNAQPWNDQIASGSVRLRPV